MLQGCIARAAKSVEQLAPWTGLRTPGREGLALDQLHRQPHILTNGADVVHRDDVAVAQLGEGLGLADYACAGLAGRTGLRALGADQLNGDLAVALWVVGDVDDRATDELHGRTGRGCRVAACGRLRPSPPVRSTSIDSRLG